MSLLAPIGLRTEICKLLRMMPPALWNMIVTVLKSVKQLMREKEKPGKMHYPSPLPPLATEDISLPLRRELAVQLEERYGFHPQALSFCYWVFEA
ncbi:hypothetical protein AK812_SmicGene29547 [Symbiodinium microadriaticum]|uniref:Uncharacterized protein n=1 Tax=Symbiodinium microadriaticum TaxID=2951 RepID=A0A1Q9D1H0_SYMMI|nr:hypothetical protein AK812_SmicGene29547 [Symbiodinium microadriaticum]